MPPPEGDFSRTFFRSMLLRIGLVLAAMALSYGGAALGEGTGSAWGPLLGALAGLALGSVAAAWVLRRTSA